MTNKIRIKDYEIGSQKNFDLLSFYRCLPDSNEEEGLKKINDADLEDFHHSLFYPILRYCIDVLNSNVKETLDKLKYKIGIDSNKKIYVTVGRQMWDLFFTKRHASINNANIKFDYGKENFDLKYVYNLKNNNLIEVYKQYFEIPSNETNKNTKKKVKEIADEINITVEQLMKSKKKNIISKFLKGYSHQEGILKSFEAEIREKKGNFAYMPNLIFKPRNDEGRTIEELDQIYLLELKEKEISINGFNVFYYYDSKTRKTKITLDGNPLILKKDNLYFIEIKKSISGLKISYENVQDKKILKHKSKSTKYRREDLTEVGNALLTSSIFSDLIGDLYDRGYEKNILYIVDDAFDIEMTKEFEKCLEHDKEIIEDFPVKIYLIYTQPDLALEHFIEESIKQNEKINFLEDMKIEREKELKEKDKKMKEYDEKIQYLEKRFSYSSQFVNINEDVSDFCKKIKNKKRLMTVGLKDICFENHDYTLTSLEALNSYHKELSNDDYYLIDFSTFNYITFTNIDNESIVNYILDIYKREFIKCLRFKQYYILADFAFMMHFSDIVGEQIFRKYKISIYMFENYYFMIYFEEQKGMISPEINIYKNKCLNPMLTDNELNLDIYKVDEFAFLYKNLLKKRELFNAKKEDNLSTNLFDFKGNINYNLYLCYNQKINKLNCFVKILSVKSTLNYIIDDLSEDFIAGFNYNKIIFVRKTEFGKSFTKEEIKLMINYLFNNKIEDIVIEEKINKSEKISITKEIINKRHELVTINKNDNFLYFYALLQSLETENKDIITNKESTKAEKKLSIDAEKISLVEYLYFISMPILLEKNFNNPKVLILSNDFGLLNFYYTELYKDKLQISSYVESKDHIIKENYEFNNKNIIISKFDKVIADNRNKSYDLILP